MDYDLVAVGGGFAGLTAVARASQLGLRAAVFERSSDERHMCSSRVATGVFTFLGTDPTADVEEIYGIIMSATDGTARPEIARTFASNAGRAYRWLLDEGAEFKRSPAVAGQLILAPARRMRHGLDWPGRGPDLLMHRLERNIVDRGGALVRGASVESLVMEHGRCVGIEVVSDGERRVYRSGAVVVADGGFHGNVEMVRQHIAPRPDRVLLRAPPAAVGDGIRMAAAVGAEVGGFGQFYGHLHHRDAMTNPELWPYPHLDYLVEVALLVGEDGKRFIDEGMGGVAIANAIARMDDPLSASVVFDDTTWAEAGPNTKPVPANPGILEGGAQIYTASTLEELAEQASVDAGNLIDTVAQHNRAIDTNSFTQLDPPRSAAASDLTSMAVLFKTPPSPRRVADPPFHAMPLCSGYTEPMGGIWINGNAQPLRATGEAIPGLYAAGHVIAGLEGGPRTGFFGGFPKAFILGLVATDHAAATAGARVQSNGAERSKLGS